jgi:hypothetical protein
MLYILGYIKKEAMILALKLTPVYRKPKNCYSGHIVLDEKGL